MPNHSFIIRFPDEHSRDQFQSALEGSVAGHVQFGELLPDAIVQDVSDQDLEKIKSIADPHAEFFDDIRFEVPTFSRPPRQ